VTDPSTRPPRWDPDERGIGVGDARAFLAELDALRAQAVEPGWVAEDPDAHLLPRLSESIASGAPWRLEATGTEADGTFAIRLGWMGGSDAGRGAIRAAVVALISEIAEGTTLIHERRAEGVVSYAVITGDLPGETRFATHGHTLVLTIDEPGGPHSPGGPPSTAATG
jgi:hypothetical protein